ncbi:MAG: hypothetical protein R3E93_15170 [Thiothrix sp.]
MPFSNQPTLETSKPEDLPLLQERYALRRCMAETALGKLYWAQDMKPAEGSNQTNVLVFTLLPALAQNPVFEQVFGHVLPTYQKPVPGMPQVSDDGKTPEGIRWMVIPSIGGMLLSERLAELDERGMPIPDATELLDSLASAIANQRPEGIFGYLEPGSILLGEKTPCLLTAPVAAALRSAYNNNHGDRHRQTLHSGYISPEVLLGDLPTSEDDTFSMACIAYHLLQGEPPFGKQSTLEATVRNLSPASIRKLRPDAWQVLQQGLNLKRAARQKTPTTLLRALQRKQKRKLMLPAAALVAAGTVAISTYHLLSSWGLSGSKPAEPTTATAVNVAAPALQENTPAAAAALVGENTPTPVLDQESVQRERDKLAAETAAAQLEAERLAAEAADKDLNSLQEKAADAIRKGKLVSEEPDTLAALDYLRKAVALEPDNIKTRKLLAQMVNDQHAEAENLLTQGQAEEAGKLLAATDRLITEFTLADSLKRQVSLETEVEQAKRKAALAAENNGEPDTAKAADADKNTTDTNAETADTNTTQYLERARRAIGYGNLNSGDERSESAVAYLSTLLEKSPSQPEALKLMEKVATLQQEKAVSYLGKRDTETARSWLDESQSLIGKYKLDALVEEQIALEKRYRETLAMGIFKPGEEPASVSTPPVATPTPTATAVPAPPAVPNSIGYPSTPPANTTEPAAVPPTLPTAGGEMTPTNTSSATITATPSAPVTPMEVSVPDDIPVQGALEIPTDTAITPLPPPTTELPPVQLDAPPVAAPAYDPAPATVTFEVPEDNGNTFTPDVPNLMEVPLDVIKEGLSATDGQNQ